MTVRERLFLHQDKNYAAFQLKLIPNITKDKCIGVRVPEIRKIAKEMYREKAYKSFFADLPHAYYDENILHGLLISEIKDYETCIHETDMFLPYVDNWAVCDTMSPHIFMKNKDKLILKINEWVDSPHTYTCRFGVKMLMSHFLDSDFHIELLSIPAGIHSDDYYVKMMVAWFYATALSKQWEATFPIIEKRKLDTWVHNKTIQKAKESYRISCEQKKILMSYKI